MIFASRLVKRIGKMLVSKRSKEEKKHAMACAHLGRVCMEEYRKNGWSGKVHFLAGKGEDMGCAWASGIDWKDHGGMIPSDEMEERARNRS